MMDYYTDVNIDQHGKDMTSIIKYHWVTLTDKNKGKCITIDHDSKHSNTIWWYLSLSLATCQVLC